MLNIFLIVFINSVLAKPLYRPKITIVADIHYVDASKEKAKELQDKASKKKVFLMEERIYSDDQGHLNGLEDWNVYALSRMIAISLFLNCSITDPKFTEEFLINLKYNENSRIAWQKAKHHIKNKNLIKVINNYVALLSTTSEDKRGAVSEPKLPIDKVTDLTEPYFFLTQALINSDSTKDLPSITSNDIQILQKGFSDFKSCEQKKEQNDLITKKILIEWRDRAMLKNIHKIAKRAFLEHKNLFIFIGSAHVVNLANYLLEEIKYWDFKIETIEIDTFILDKTKTIPVPGVGNLGVNDTKFIEINKIYELKSIMKKHKF